LESRKKFGIYLVATGFDFGLKNCITSNKYYVVNEITKIAIGMYTEEQLAINLAKGLDKRDQKRLSDEMDKILRNKQGNTDE